MTLKDKNRNDAILYRLELCKKSQEETEFCLNNNMLKLAAYSLYYSGFYALSALALKEKFSTKKHKQLLGWFNSNFVKTGVVDKRYGRIIRRAYEVRTKMDYEDFFVSNINDLEELSSDMKDFINKIEGLINIEK
jgi:uncharacterized protein (UPF0332 family)